MVFRAALLAPRFGLAPDDEALSAGAAPRAL